MTKAIRYSFTVIDGDDTYDVTIYNNTIDRVILLRSGFSESEVDFNMLDSNVQDAIINHIQNNG